jgi:hypothetical protein
MGGLAPLDGLCFSLRFFAGGGAETSSSGSKNSSVANSCWGRKGRLSDDFTLPFASIARSIAVDNLEPALGGTAAVSRVILFDFGGFSRPSWQQKCLQEVLSLQGWLHLQHCVRFSPSVMGDHLGGKQRSEKRTRICHLAVELGRRRLQRGCDPSGPLSLRNVVQSMVVKAARRQNARLAIVSNASCSRREGLHRYRL